MWRRRGMISSWENPHYLKVNHWRSSERLHSLTTPPVTSVQPPRTLGRRSPSTSPIILLLGSGRSSHRRPVSTRLRPTAPARLFRPCSCASIDRDATRRDATAGPPACWPAVSRMCVVAELSAPPRITPSITSRRTRRQTPLRFLASPLLRREGSSELREHIQRPPSSCAKAVASAAAFLSGQLSVPPPVTTTPLTLEDSRSLNFLWLLLPPAAPISFRGTRGRGGV
jgi:hypothetical protein